jgi:16S rRNA (uracil1498-N3)-methyltransferase
MNLFYSADITEPETILSSEESKHIIRVLRKSEGDIVFFTDGKGYNYKCEILEANPIKCRISIIEKNKGKDSRDINLHIAIAPTKNITRFEWFLEKTTEIGIDFITPVITSHSERKEIKPDRLIKVLISAMKQSLKSHLPIFNLSQKYNEFITMPFEGDKYIAYISDDITVELKDIYNSGSNALILIGPEGDFSIDEVKIAIENGFIPVSLGKSRLRTETAGVVACHTISILNI